MFNTSDIALGLGVTDALGSPGMTFVALPAQVNTSPSKIKLGSNESYGLSFDFTAKIVPTDQLSSATVVLTDVLMGTNYSQGILGSPYVVGDVVTQEVGSLIPLHWYLLQVSTVTIFGDQYEMGLIIVCPY